MSEYVEGIYYSEITERYLYWDGNEKYELSSSVSRLKEELKYNTRLGTDTQEENARYIKEYEYKLYTKYTLNTPIKRIEVKI